MCWCPPLPRLTQGLESAVAIFCACFLLTQKAEIVVFRQTQHTPRSQGATPRFSHRILSWVGSPARRASRKLLERVIEFVNILGHKPIEFNQEQARMKCYNGEESLIRSFPCAAAMPTFPASLHKC